MWIWIKIDHYGCKKNRRCLCACLSSSRKFSRSAVCLISPGISAVGIGRRKGPDGKAGGREQRSTAWARARSKASRYSSVCQSVHFVIFQLCYLHGCMLTLPVYSPRNFDCKSCRRAMGISLNPLTWTDNNRCSRSDHLFGKTCQRILQLSGNARELLGKYCQEILFKTICWGQDQCLLA